MTAQNGTTDNLVELDHLTKRFAVKQGVFARGKAEVHAVEDISLTSAGARRSASSASPAAASRRPPADPAAPRPDRRHDPFRRARHLQAVAAPTATAAARDADDLPGSVLVAQPAQDGRPDRRCAVRDPRGQRRQAARAGAARDASVSAPSTTTAIRTSSPAGSGSASASRARLRCQPKLIVCDEPVSALDVSIQAQILNLLRSLQDEFNLTYVFISHDLSVIRQIADRIAVMYLGKIVELGDSESIYEQPEAPVHGCPPLGRARPTRGGGPPADRALRRRAVAGRPSGRVRLPSTLPSLPQGALRRRHAACSASSSRATRLPVTTRSSAGR